MKYKEFKKYMDNRLIKNNFIKLDLKEQLKLIDNELTSLLFRKYKYNSYLQQFKFKTVSNLLNGPICLKDDELLNTILYLLHILGAIGGEEILYVDGKNPYNNTNFTFSNGRADTFYTNNMDYHKCVRRLLIFMFTDELKEDIIDKDKSIQL